MNVRVGLWRKLSAEELMLLNCGVGEDSWESLGLQGDPTSPSERRLVLDVHWKDWCWSWNSNTLAAWCEELTHWKRPWCWERLKAGGEGDDRGWDGWMASPTQWTWVWANSGSWWWTGKPGVLQSKGSQRVGDDRVTELNVPSYVYITSSSFIWRLINYWVVPAFWPLWIMLVQTFVYNFTSRHQFSFLMSIYLGVEMLVCMKTLNLTI